jgi:2-polyprenyl-6-methoxyphenol hydroxylase-like FAD-dependent oxidoreductase
MPESRLRAIVVGSSMAGMFAARVLSEHFAQVTLLERDVQPSGPAHRAGVAQSKHVHMLLLGGQQALEALFPGIERELAALGAVPLRAGYDLINIDDLGEWPQRDLGLSSNAQSRLLLESVVRARLAASPNVETRWGCRVDGPLVDADKRHVTGVRYHADGAQHELTADLVIDATGRQARTLDWLRELGYALPTETRIEVDIGYASAIFDIPSPARLATPGVVILPGPPATRGGLLQTIEGARWHVTLGGRLGDHPPTDIAGFREFAESLVSPKLFDAIADLTPLDAIAGFRYPASIRRRFEKLTEFPEGLLVIGDALCTLNPIYGQGMSSAAMQARALGPLLAETLRDKHSLTGLWRTFFPVAAQIVAAPWAQAGSVDLAYPGTIGVRPASFAASQQFSRALTQLSFEDAGVHKLVIEVMQFVKPQSAFRDPALVERVVARIQQNLGSV